MRKNTDINITKEKRADMVTAIKNYFSKERDEEMGDLAASLTLDFIIEELAPEFYNQGVYDSIQYMKSSVEDLWSIQK